MRAGERVEVDPKKEDPMDFVLWKPSEGPQDGASFPSPWGMGRPGWHIECSAMAEALLGERFDIHGGGIDLQFPHHENELAQSACAHGHEGMAQVWMHNEMLQVEGRKMSKSLGNFFTVRDLLDKGYPGEVIRFVLLSTHYRKPMDWTEEKAEEAERTLRKWRTLAGGIEPSATVAPAVIEALADDLNTAGAVAALHELAGKGDTAGLAAGAALLGLLTPEMGGWATAPETGKAEAVIEALMAARLAARKARDFARADAIRDGLASAGVIVKDTPAGAVWELAADFDPAKLEALK
jgi:cysteinyl-tRNA synthetase